MDVLPDGGYSSYAAGERQGPARDRSEQLYYAEDFGIFFLTGQYRSLTLHRTGIDVRPLHSLTSAAAERLKTQAVAWTPARDHDVAIAVIDDMLVLQDRVTQKDSYYPVEGLDAAVAGRLLRGDGGAWEKYTGAGEDARPPAPRRPGALQL